MPEQILSRGRQDRDGEGTDPGRASVRTSKIHTSGKLRRSNDFYIHLEELSGENCKFSSILPYNPQKHFPRDKV